MPLLKLMALPGIGAVFSIHDPDAANGEAAVQVSGGVGQHIALGLDEWMRTSTWMGGYCGAGALSCAGAGAGVLLCFMVFSSL